MADDNEVFVRRVLRLYRNSLVSHIRCRLRDKFGEEAEAELSSLFQKKDPTSGKTQWDRMKENANLARATPEISTTVADGFELLGVSDFFNVIDKFFDILVRGSIPSDPAIRQEAKKGLLRCVQQAKVFRDPNAHDVTEPIDHESVLLCVANCIKVAGTLGLTSDVERLRQLMNEAATRVMVRKAVVVSIPAENDMARELSNALIAQDVLVSHQICAARFIEISPLPEDQNILIIASPSSNSGGDLTADDVKALDATINACTVQRRQFSILTHFRLDLAGLAGKLGQPAIEHIELSKPLVLHPDYLDTAIQRLIPKLRPSTVQPLVRSLPAKEVVEVAVAEAIHNAALAPRLFKQLENTDLDAATIIAPYIVDVSPRHLRTRLSRLLIDAVHRGALVQVVTTPPNRKDDEYEEKMQLLDQLHREGIEVFVNEILHAKAYLFRRKGDRQTWIVGSHNMTNFALGRNLETSMLGYRKAEFAQATTTFDNVRRHRETITYDFWRAREMKASPSRGRYQQ